MCACVRARAGGGRAAGGQREGFALHFITSGSGVNAAAAGQKYAAPHRLSLNLLYELYDDAFVTKGNHSMKFGFTYMPDETNAYHDSGGNGSATFTATGQPTTYKEVKPAGGDARRG